MPPVVSAAEFLKAIWGDTKGLSELTIISKNTVKSFAFTYPDAVQSLVDASKNHNNKNANTYMGVCLRKERWPRKNSRGQIEYRGTEENALSSRVVWCEFDFSDMGHKGKTIPEEQAKKVLKEFPLKPSIVIRSGGGIQVYWLLKEIVQGDDLWKLKATNKAVSELLGADTQAVDLARILRIPGSLNFKYTPPRPCNISWWRPDLEYLLDDFDFMPIETLQRPIQPSEANPQAGTVYGPGSTSASEPRKKPSTKLSEDKIHDIAHLLSKIWMEGSRHPIALRVAGWLAFSGVDIESAKSIVCGASDAVGGESQKRIKDVEGTYKSFENGEEIAGRPALIKIIESSFPPLAKPEALKVLDEVKKKLPKPPRGGGNDGNGGGPGGHGNDPDPDFHVVSALKFDSSPARWEITISKDGRNFITTVETNVLWNFKLFQQAMYEQNHIFIRKIRDDRWQQMLPQDDAVKVQETPKEAKPAGAIEKVIEEFTAAGKENPDIGLLKAYAGYDDLAQYFRFPTLRDALYRAGERIENRVVYARLRELDWENTTRRFGATTVNVWQKKFKGTPGPLNGNGNGHPVIPAAPTPESKAAPKPDETGAEGEFKPELQGDLFEGEPDVLGANLEAQQAVQGAPEGSVNGVGTAGTQLEAKTPGNVTKEAPPKSESEILESLPEWDWDQDPDPPPSV